MDLKKLITTLAKRAGVEQSEIEEIVSQIGEVSVSDNFSQKLETNLYDVESAKQNYTLKQHFTALALNGVDTQLQMVMDELGIDDEVKSELSAIKSTPQRAVNLARKIKELESKKTSVDDKGDSGKAKKAQEEIDRLISEFKQKETQYQSEIEKEKQSKFDMIADYKEDLLLHSIKYPNELPQDVNVLTAKQLINKFATEKGAKKVYNKESGKFELKRADDESLDWYDERNNKPLSYEDFVKGALAQNKFIAVSDSKNDNPQPQQIQANGSGLIDTSKFDKAVDEAISYQN